MNESEHLETKPEKVDKTKGQNKTEGKLTDDKEDQFFEDAGCCGVSDYFPPETYLRGKKPKKRH